MADINVYFFWPGLVFSLILSILFSVLLTIGSNFWMRKREPAKHSVDDGCSDENDTDNIETERADDFGTQASGMILIGPIPIVFGTSGVRFDKNVFKYTLVFFLTVLNVWFLFTRIVRL